MFNQLKHLFSGQKFEDTPSSLTDFSLMGVDMHSHLIPGIDDGVKSMQDSIAILRKFQDLGFRKIITSPHVVSDGYNNSTETILKGRDKVREAIKENNLQIEFDAVAEYYLDYSINEKIEKKDLLTFGKNYVLVELSYLTKTNNIHDLMYKLQIAGYRIILAHPERYPYYYEKDFAQYHTLKDRNVYFQINLMSLVGKYGKGAKSTAEKMIDENMVNFVGTDLHNENGLEVIKSCLKEKYLEKILTCDRLLNKTLL